MDIRTVVNEAEVEGTVFAGPEGFEGKHKRLGAAAGSRRLGCTLTEVPAGKAPFPMHAYFAMEEAAFVLSGTGTLRMGAKRIEIKAGDYIAMPTGKEFAHQIINTGDQPLRFLCFSTMADIEVVSYPDSEKVGVTAGLMGDPVERKFEFRSLFDVKNGHHDYWKGESQKR